MSKTWPCMEIWWTQIHFCFVEKYHNIGHRLVETDKNGRKIAVLKTRKAKRKFCYLTWICMQPSFSLQNKTCAPLVFFWCQTDEKIYQVFDTISECFLSLALKTIPSFKSLSSPQYITRIFSTMYSFINCCFIQYYLECTHQHTNSHL